MSQFIDDLINLTQGQFFLKYWWIWFAIMALGLSLLAFERLKR